MIDRLTLDKLQGIFTEAATADSTYMIKSGLRAVISALIDAAPGKEELQNIYDQYGLIGVRDYILGADRLLPSSYTNMPPQYWELHAKHAELKSKYDDLQERHEELLRNNNEDVQALKEAAHVKFNLRNMLEVAYNEATKAKISVDIIRTNLNELVKSANKTKQ